MPREKGSETVALVVGCIAGHGPLWVHCPPVFGSSVLSLLIVFLCFTFWRDALPISYWSTARSDGGIIHTHSKQVERRPSLPKYQEWKKRERRDRENSYEGNESVA